MSHILIRELRPGDIPAITTIHNQRSVAEMTLQIPYSTEAERQERWKTTDSARFVVAEIDGQVVGLAGLTLMTRRRAHVGTIGMAVDERFRGQGVGRALVNALIDLADNWYNLRRIELEVYVDNAAAIHLYETCGFTIEGRLRDFAFRSGTYVDAYVMARIRDDLPRLS
jgi:putative acetyltransferase